jgi:PAS domain S-box/PAS domain S-box
MTHRLQEPQSHIAAGTADLRLATVLSTAVDGIVTIDDRGIILTVNHAAERLFGYAAEEMIGRNVNLLMPEPYHSAHDGFLARYRDTGERRIIGIGREVMARRKDGSTFPMELAVGEAWLSEGRIFTGIIRDITDRKRAESESRAATQMMESVIAALPVAVISVGPDGNVLLWNRAAEDILGWTAGEAVGGPMPAALFADDGVGALAAGLRDGAALGNEEVRCRRKDGTVIEVSLSTAPLRDESGRLVSTVWVMDDVTQRKSLASQLYQAQKMEAVGQLTGGLAHDFNNILGVSIGNLDLLAEEVEGDPGKLDLVEAAQGALLKGADLTRQLLAFARRQPLQPQHVRIEELLAASIRMLRRTLGEQIEVSFRVDGTVWPVAVDIAQLEAAITNLAINARDAMAGGGRLAIVLGNAGLDEEYAATVPDLRPGDYVLVEVCDNGHGMSPEILARVFEPFFTTKPPGKGTGLGLSMVYGFIRQSGGHVRIYSEVGHGTTVKLYLPRVAMEEDATTAAEPEPMRGGNETILVVEDNPDVRRVVVRQLKSLGYGVMEAAEALAAADILRGGAPIDLLFTDVVMPHGMSGFDLGREAERLRPGLKVLFTSGFPSTSLASAPEIGEGIQLLSKPYRKQDLARAVRGMLEGRSGDDGQQVAGHR